MSRLITVQFGTLSLTVIASKGCPQGGVLPPLVWCLVINELIKKLNDNNFQTEGFSDDLATLLKGKFLNTLCELLQSVLDIVSEWCEENGLSVNPSKTKMIIFTRKRKIVGLKIPLINGTPIVLVNEVKYLGIILDSGMYWIANLDSRLQKALIALWQCRKGLLGSIA